MSLASRPSRSLLAVALLVTPLVMAASPTLAQQAPAQADPATPREMSRVRAEFARVRDRMEAVQRDFDRAARNNLPAVRDAALKDWQRALDGVEPYVKGLSPDVPEEKQLIEEYNRWLELYSEAAGTGNAGEFFLQISRHWSELTAGTEGWEQETTPLTYDALLAADAGDPNLLTLGMPKTVAFAIAADRYITDVTTREDYARYKGAENVKTDLAQAEAARGRAQEKLVQGAQAILSAAEGAKLDQAGRDRIERLFETDLAVPLAGTDALTDLQNRERTAVRKWDVANVGEQQAGERAMVRLTTAANTQWPRILAKYAATPMAPEGRGRGQIVKITGVRNRLGKDFAAGTYDFAGFVNGAPVVGNYVPGVAEHVKSVLEQTGQKSLPDVDYELIAIVRGTTQIPAVKRPGVTTAPATADEATATTAPANTDAAVLDIVALRAGPACVGTKVVVTPQQ